MKSQNLNVNRFGRFKYFPSQFKEKDMFVCRHIIINIYTSRDDFNVISLVARITDGNSHQNTLCRYSTFTNSVRIGINCFLNWLNWTNELQASQVQQHKVTSLLSEPQRALLSTITTGREIIKHTEEHLSRVSLLTGLFIEPGVIGRTVY